ncbi:MAG: hypothetical protein Q7R80_02250 [bacterium]|nr:hypothetical protein [bacterium]
MTITEKATELGVRLAQSTAPPELKATIIELLPKLTERDLDRILYSLRFEEGEHTRLEAALQGFQEQLRTQWAALEQEERWISDEAIADFLNDTASQAAQRSISAAA